MDVALVGLFISIDHLKSTVGVLQNTIGAHIT